MQSPRRTPKVAGPRRDEFAEYPNAFTDALYPTGGSESVDKYLIAAGFIDAFRRVRRATRAAFT